MAAHKIANPTILARISPEELDALFRGYGYTREFEAAGEQEQSAHKQADDAREGKRRVVQFRHGLNCGGRGFQSSPLPVPGDEREHRTNSWTKGCHLVQTFASDYWPVWMSLLLIAGSRRLR